jgi:hypothetical protein
VTEQQPSIEEQIAEAERMVDELGTGTGSSQGVEDENPK